MTALDLDTLRLDTGSHPNPEAGMCLLEAVALFSGEPFGARPTCVSPVLISFGISINDRFDVDRRQQLKRFIPLLPGTAGDGLDESRSYLALDWLIRAYTPAFLDLRPELAKHATALRGLAAIVDLATAQAANPVMVAAGEAAGEAARGVAGDAAWTAARAAARAAARGAAGDAAVDAAWTAAGDAAWAAARGAAGDAAWTAAWAAAWAAARAAAWAAARGAAGDAAVVAAGDAAGDAAWTAAWTAARAAAGDALQPTVDRLQDSAGDLFARMINPTGELS